MAETNAANAELRERLRRYEDRMHPSYALGFDGAKLMLRENGEPIMSWPAVSGRPGKQGPEYQSYRDHGPLPQGGYRVNVSEMQRYEDLSYWDQLIAPFDRGPWKGDTPAWAGIDFG